MRISRSMNMLQVNSGRRFSCAVLTAGSCVRRGRQQVSTIRALASERNNTHQDFPPEFSARIARHEHQQPLQRVGGLSKPVLHAGLHPRQCSVRPLLRPGRDAGVAFVERQVDNLIRAQLTAAVLPLDLDNVLQHRLDQLIALKVFVQPRQLGEDQLDILDLHTAGNKTCHASQMGNLSSSLSTLGRQRTSARFR
jgi:hypothetical protein